MGLFNYNKRKFGSPYNCPQGHLAEIYQIVSGGSFSLVDQEMNKFLAKGLDLTASEVAFIMAAYGYNQFNAKLLLSDYPFVNLVDVGGKNQMVGVKYLPSHCSQFAKQYRKSIISAPDYVKEQFYKIFPLRWETEMEHRQFSAHGPEVAMIQNAPRLLDRDSVMQENAAKLFEHLYHDQNHGKYVLVVGAGVSNQLVADASSRKIVGSWEGLVTLLRVEISAFVGIEVNALFDKWFPVSLDRDRKLMDRAHMLHSMVKVYNLYHDADIDYRNFLSALFHPITPITPPPPVALALATRNVPIATTNYDVLLERCLKRHERNLPAKLSCEPDSAECEQERAKIKYSNYCKHIYHLHGVWHSGEELVLGVEYAACDKKFRKSMDVLTTELSTNGVPYEYSVNDRNTRVTSTTKPLVFVGTGAGAFDAHFLPWLRQSDQTHYILVKEDQFENLTATIKNACLTDKLIPVVYGAEYNDLAGFLEKLPVRTIE